ncbi:hypothetical protein B0H13DRAFT_2648541 [Mycena leptocephala]|nr:hypothetical protein B0H13DRAFT_2648541 [Mycena leptocephala]
MSRYQQGAWYLPPRGKCLHPECTDNCAGFICEIANEYREYPNQPTSLCLCAHSYLGHVMFLQDDPDDPNNKLQRGVNLQANCGGFFKLQTIWERPPQKLQCDFCRYGWLAHAGKSSGSGLPSAPPPSIRPPEPMTSSMSMILPPQNLPAGRAEPSSIAFSQSNPFSQQPLRPSASTSTLLPTGNGTAFLSNPFSSTHPLPLPFAGGNSVATLSLPQTVASNPFIASALPSPAAAFSGVPAPIAPFHVQGNSTGTIQSQRAESLARIASRPPSSQISPSRQNRSRSAASARATTSTTSARPFGQVTDANSTPLNPGQHAYLICFLPFTLGQHHHQDADLSFLAYKFKTHTELPSLLRLLERFNLSTRAVISSERDLWRQFDRHIKQHLQDNNIILPADPMHPDGSEFEWRRWEFLLFRAIPTTQNRALTVLPMVERECTYATLAKAADRQARVALSPVNISILTFSLQPPDLIISVGPCTAMTSIRILASPGVCLVSSDSEGNGPSQDVSGTCIKRAGESPEPTIEPESKRAKWTATDDDILYDPKDPDYLPSPLELITAQSHSRPDAGPSQLPNIIDLDSDDDEGESDDLVQKLLSAETPIVPLDHDAITLWRTGVYNTIGSEDNVLPLTVSGPTVESVAVSLLGLIAYIHAGEGELDQYSAEAGVILEPAPIPGFLHSGRLFRIYTDPAKPTESGATGPGPERAVYVKGLAIRLGHSTRWVKSSGMYTRPSFYNMEEVVRPEHVAGFQVDGAWAALFIVEVGIGPDPLCPFLLLAASQLNREWVGDLTLQYIHALDPSAARTLAPWFAVEANTVFKFPVDNSHPAMALVAAYLSIPITDFVSPRDAATHRAMHLSILCHFFFNRSNPYKHPEFLAFARGFNLQLGSSAMIDHCRDIVAFKALVAAIYNRRILAVDDVIRRLQFRAPTNFDRITGLRRELFQLRFLRWIRGAGYPRSVRRFVGITEYRAQRKNPVLRAEAFLYSMIGMRVIPADPDFSLTIDLVHSFDPRQKTSLGFHDCAATVDVFLSEWTDNLLLQDVDFDDLKADTAFDQWLSSEFSLTHGDYNDW